MKLPTELGAIHFVGIGGIGMSGIAEVLHNLGYQVQGSDLSDSANVKRLREKGILVAVGHAPENLKDAEVVVVSTAIQRDNPELMAAREVDAFEELRRDCGNSRQDHNNVAGCNAA